MRQPGRACTDAASLSRLTAPLASERYQLWRGRNTAWGSEEQQIRVQFVLHCLIQVTRCQCLAHCCVRLSVRKWTGVAHSVSVSLP